MNPLHMRTWCALAAWVCAGGAHALSVDVVASSSYGAQLTGLSQSQNTTNEVFVRFLSAGPSFVERIASPAWQESIDGILYDVRTVTVREGQNVRGEFGSVDSVVSQGRVVSAAGAADTGEFASQDTWLDLTFTFSAPAQEYLVVLYGEPGAYRHPTTGQTVPVAGGVLVDGMTPEERGNTWSWLLDSSWSQSTAQAVAGATGVTFQTDHLPGGRIDRWFARIQGMPYNLHEKTYFSGYTYSFNEMTVAAVPEADVVALAIAGGLVALGSARKRQGEGA